MRPWLPTGYALHAAQSRRCYAAFLSQSTIEAREEAYWLTVRALTQLSRDLDAALRDDRLPETVRIAADASPELKTFAEWAARLRWLRSLIVNLSDFVLEERTLERIFELLDQLPDAPGGKSCPKS